MKTYAEYLKDAQNQYDPSYNEKVNAINAAMNSGMTAYDNQTGTVNKTYDTQLNDQNKQNTVNKNYFDNINSGRGLGRSTILTTGLAGMDDRNTSLLGKINDSRSGELNSIAANKATLQTNSANQISQLAGDRQSQLANLIAQYQSADRAYDLQLQQLQLQKDQFAYQKSQAGKSSRSGSSGGGSSPTSNKKALQSAVENALEAGRGSQFVHANKNNIIKYLGQSFYNSLLKRVDDAEVLPYYYTKIQSNTRDYVNQLKNTNNLKWNINMSNGR